MKIFIFIIIYLSFFIISLSSHKHDTKDNDQKLGESTNYIVPDQCGFHENGKIRPFKVMVAFSEAYFPVFVNWLLFYKKSCSDNSHLYTLCFDHKTDILLQHIGLNCSFIHVIPTSNPSQVWPARNQEVKKILHAGYDVFESDVDAIWLRNPFPIIERNTDSVFIASRGSHPPEVSKKYGASICMGFVYIKTCPFTLHMWDQLLPKIVGNPSNGDQKPVNMYIESHYPLQYSHKLTYIDSIKPDTATFQYGDEQLKLTLLAHHDVVRICDEKILENATVAHCLSDKNGKDKHIVAAKYKLWLLEKGWERNLSKILNLPHNREFPIVDTSIDLNRI